MGPNLRVLRDRLRPRRTIREGPQPAKAGSKLRSTRHGGVSLQQIGARDCSRIYFFNDVRYRSQVSGVRCRAPHVKHRIHRFAKGQRRSSNDVIASKAKQPPDAATEPPARTGCRIMCFADLVLSLSVCQAGLRFCHRMASQARHDSAAERSPRFTRGRHLCFAREDNFARQITHRALNDVIASEAKQPPDAAAVKPARTD